MSDWPRHAERELERYREGESRLGESRDDPRQRQLTRLGNAAFGAGLAYLADGRTEEATKWLRTAADRYHESWDDAPPGSWGRPIAILKSRILSGDASGAARDARWTLEQGAEDADSPTGRYAACLAHLVLGDDHAARRIADDLRIHEGFPHDVGDALATIAAGDPLGYVEAVESVLESFETRDEYLEDIPLADTVLVLQALAERRDLAAELSSPVLPD
jgi:hypothetical protein